jgi:hypothetical protein
VTPKDYFEKFAEPTYADYLADKAVHRAALVCMVVYHVVDAIFVDQGSPRATPPRTIAQSEITAHCREFELIDAVAHATKHIELDPRHNRSATPKLNIAEIQSGPAAAFSDGTYFSDGTSFSDAPAVPTINRGPGQIWDVDHTLEVVMAFLRTYLR